MQCRLRQLKQALIIFLTIRLLQSSQYFCLNLFNVYFAEPCLLLSWIFKIINFENGCLSFNKISDLVPCGMGANFKSPSQRKIPSSSSFTLKSQNLELLSLKSVKWNLNYMVFTKSVLAFFNSFGFKIDPLIVFCVWTLLRLQTKRKIQAVILKTLS